MKIKHLFLAIAFIFCAAFSIIANSADILVGQYTHHADRFYKDDCYENGKYMCNFRIKDEHALLGVNANGYTVFLMENSYERPSLSILKTFKYDLTGNIRGYISGGIVTGYDNKMPNTKYGITPAFYPGFDIHPSSDKWGVMITIVPHYFVGVGLRFNIGDDY